MRSSRHSVLGAMSEVYKARDARLDRSVAICNAGRQCGRNSGYAVYAAMIRTRRACGVSRGHLT